MGDAPEQLGFWKSFPGVLTATAAIITALTGLIVALNQAGCLNGDDRVRDRPGASPSATVRPSPTPSPTPRPGPTGTTRPPRPANWATTLDATERARLDRLRAMVRQEGPSARAADAFADLLKGKAHFTVVAYDGCEMPMTRRAITVVPVPELVLLPGSGAGCYRVAWGLFTSEFEAKETGSVVNERLRRAGLPANSRIARVSPR